MSHSINNHISTNTQNPVSTNTQNHISPTINNPVTTTTPNLGFNIIEHPADTGITFCALSIENLFEIAAEGMFSIICDTKSVGAVLKKSAALRYDAELKLDDLLILWLEKLLYIHETSRILFSKFEVKKIQAGLGVTVLEATIYGEKINPIKHEVYISVKAPTYHKLKVVYDDCKKCWYGSVIFDV